MTDTSPALSAGLVARRLRTRRDDWLVSQLPVGMLDDDLFVRLVRSFQDVAGTLLEGADNVELVVDPAVAPPAALRYLGAWVGLDLLDPASPEAFQREMVRMWGEVLAWRGTRRGLTQFLELVTGGPVEVLDDGGIFRSGEAPPQATVRVRVRAGGWLPDDELRALIADELPIHVPHALELVDGSIGGDAGG